MYICYLKDRGRGWGRGSMALLYSLGASYYLGMVRAQLSSYIFYLGSIFKIIDGGSFSSLCFWVICASSYLSPSNYANLYSP